MSEDKKPSLLRRDEHNKLDKDDAARVTQDLVRKLITEERAFQKEISFNAARGHARDLFIFITVAHRNSVDGHIVIGDNEERGFESWSERDPYKYKTFDYIEAPILVKEQPFKKAQLGRQLMGCFNVLVNWLARMGVVDGI